MGQGDGVELGEDEVGHVVGGQPGDEDGEDVKWVDAKCEQNLISWLEQALKRDGAEMWYDHALEDLPGEPFRAKIESEIRSADLAILLLSQDFASSDFIREVELPLIKARAARHELVVLPIVVAALDYPHERHLHWISDRQMLLGWQDPLSAHTGNLAEFDALRVKILRAIRSRLETGPPGR